MSQIKELIGKVFILLGVALGVFIVGFLILMQFLNADSGHSTKPEKEDGSVTYTITNKDGTCYLNFSNGNDLPPVNDGEPHASAALRFKSLSDMKDTFVNQKLTAQQIKRIKQYFPKDENGILICDLSQLYQPALPSNLRTYYDIELIGESYTFTVADTSVDPSAEEAVGTITGSFLCTNQETYELHYAEEFSGDFDNLTSPKSVADRNATVYEYTTTRGTFRVIQYEVTDGEKTLQVSEHYSLVYTEDAFGTDLPISETVPNRINIFGTQDGKYFEVTLAFLAERPTMEWLSSFGLSEYVD